MLDRYFIYPGVLRRMRQGPLRGEIDALAETLARTGYTRLSARRYLSLIASFSRYANRSGCRSPRDIDRGLVERFVRRRSWSRSTATVARTALGHVLRHVQWTPPPVHRSPGDRRDAAVLADFDHYLETTRGLDVKSRDELVRAARRLLAWYRQVRPRRALARVSAKDVLAYAAHVTATCAAHRTRSAAMSHLRNFLRYLRWCGVLQDDLARVVPRVPIWPLADLPDALPWPDVRRVIDAIDGTDAVSRRDRALVWLVATTGMRNGEIRRLELSDIQWRAGDIHLRRTKNRRERRVPLLPEAGRALAEYLLQGRPPTTERRIFLSHQPPVRPLALSSTVSAIVRRRLADVGLRPRRAGTHLLRHSLATQLVRQARPIKEVADLLGHQRIDTTAVYVKVALPQLTTVALPFPGGEA